MADEISKRIDPSRRAFVLGLLATGVTAPRIVSFALGGTSFAEAAPTKVASSWILDTSGNFTPSANYLYGSLSANFLRDQSGNFLTDDSGNLLCGTSGNVFDDPSGNIFIQGSANVALNPSGNWLSDPSGNVYLPSDLSGQYVYLDPSGNFFTDGYMNVCAVSANHVAEITRPTTTTSSSVPSTPTTTTSVPSTTSTTVSRPSGSASANDEPVLPATK